MSLLKTTRFLLSLLLTCGVLAVIANSRLVTAAAFAVAGWSLSQRARDSEHDSADAAVGHDPSATVKSALRSLATSAAAIVAGRQSACKNGVGQVQAILDDAAGKLQASFASLHEQVTTESRFIDQLVERVEMQVSDEEPSSLVNVAKELKRLLERSIAQLHEMASQCSVLLPRFDTMASNGDAMLGLLEQADEIRRETVVLALNAAIEAARAGEHGRAFAQVAASVRELSKKAQSFDSELATRTREMIASMQDTRATVTRLSACDLATATDSVVHVGDVLVRLRADNESMEDEVRRLMAAQERVNSDVARAVTALQFEDLARQRLDSIVHDIESMERSMQSLTDAVVSEIAVTDDAAHGLLDDRLAELCDRLVSAGRDQEAPSRVTVQQVDMEAGDVELF